MRAFSVFLDEQWLQAVSEKDMTVPAKFLASKLQAELPVQVQYVGLTKILFLFDEEQVTEEKMEYLFRQLLEKQMKMDFDMQEAVINFRIDPVELEEEEETKGKKSAKSTTVSSGDLKNSEDNDNRKRRTLMERLSAKKRMTQPGGKALEQEVSTETETSDEETGTEFSSEEDDMDHSVLKETNPDREKNREDAPLSFGKKHKLEKPEQEEEDPNPALTKIRALKGSNQLIELCERLHRISDRIYEDETAAEKYADLLDAKAYLFSVEQGIGLNTRISLFFEFMNEDGLLNAEGGGMEVRLSYGGSTGIPMDVAKQLVAQEGISMFSFDISAWIGHLDQEEFRDFLFYLYGAKDAHRYSFRIPYVESGVMKQVEAAISDIFTVETIVIPPMGRSELEEYALGTLESFGYHVTPEALPWFRLRIAEEKSDGRFYGMDTVDKITDEIILEKMGSHEDEKNITAEDMKALVSHTYEEKDPATALHDMIGVSEVEVQLRDILEEIVSGKNDLKNMWFIGNPGTGRTSVARIVGSVLHDRGVLRDGWFTECSIDDLVGEVPGETVPKTLTAIRDAAYSVLFIDAAYHEKKKSIDDADEMEEDPDEEDAVQQKEYFRREVMETLITEMKEKKDTFVVMSATENDMRKLKQEYPELQDVIPYAVTFRDFTRDELSEIFFRMARRAKVELSDEVREDVQKYFSELPDSIFKKSRFSNARYVRNLFDEARSKSELHAALSHSVSNRIEASDFHLATVESAGHLNRKEKHKYPIGFRLQAEE